MVDEINELLRKICWKLSRGDVANYVVDIRIFQAKRQNDFNDIDSIRNILGGNSVEVGEVKRSNSPELIESIKEGFEYEGDEGAHPNKNYLFTDDFKDDTNEVLAQIENLFSGNSEISVFWLKSGHPFYPVFWDYAFLIKKDYMDYLLIGSSSD